MKHKISGKQATKFQVGEYYLQKEEMKVFRVVEDRDRGIAVMDVESSYIATDFYENMEELARETILGGMVRLKQKNEVEFDQKFN